MKRAFFLSLAAVSLSALLSGCYIELAAFTKIKPDGSGFRITSYSASTESQKDELAQRYELPEGGTWKSEAQKPNLMSYPQSTYEVKRRFGDFNGLAPDYARKGLKPGNVSRNSFSLKVNTGFVFTTYEYAETFRDTAQERQVKDFCDGWYDYAIDVACGEVEAALPKLAERRKFRAFLDGLYRPYYDYFLGQFLKGGIEPFLDDENLPLQEKMDAFGEIYCREEFVSAAADYLAAHNKGMKRDAAIEKLNEAYAGIEEELQRYSAQMLERNYDDNFGVYGLPLLSGYPFRNAVVMPGKIIRSNSKEVKGNAAKWSFCSSDFFLKEYRMEATSRRLNPLCVGISALFIVAVFAALSFKGLRKIWK